MTVTQNNFQQNPAGSNQRITVFFDSFAGGDEREDFLTECVSLCQDDGLVHFFPFDSAVRDHVIWSPCEDLQGSGAGFWSNELGWVDFDQATHFTETEAKAYWLPISLGGDARWVRLDEVMCKRFAYMTVGAELEDADA